MPNLSDTISDGLTIQTINLLRAAVGHEKEVLRMLASLERELVSDLHDVVGKTDFTVARMRELLSQTRAAIGAAYGRIAVANEKGLVDMATVAAGQTVGVLNAALGVAVTSVAWTPEQIARLATSTIVEGGTAAQWWASQDQKLREAFQREMQLGQLRGETVDQLAARVRGTKAMGYKDGIMQAPRRQAQALVRTSALGVANQARLDVYAANDEVVRGVQWMATLDPRTCLVCMGLDGLAWDYPDGDGSADYAEWKPAKRGPWAQWHKKRFEPAPIHFNCRCVVVPVTYSWKELAGTHGNTKAAAIADRIPENKRASMDGQVAASMTFDKWLAGKPAEFQDNVLGPARAKAWRAGEVKLQGLADQSHNPLNLAQLGIERARKEVLQPAAPLPPVPAPKPVPAVEDLQAAVKEAEKKIPPALPGYGAEIRLRRPADGSWRMQGMQMQGGDRVWVDLPLGKFDDLPEARRIAGLRGYRIVEEVRRFGAAVKAAGPAPALPIPRGPSPATRLPGFMRPTPKPGAPMPPSMKQDLVTKKIKEFKAGKGGSSEATPVVFEDGTKGMWKPQSGESSAGRDNVRFYSKNKTDPLMAHAHDREVATSDIADIVGMSDPTRLAVVPHAVERTIGGEVGSMARWTSDRARNAWAQSSDIRYDGPADHSRAAAWDFFIGQTDRHGDNWMVDASTGRMYLIDNGLTFPAPVGSTSVDAQFRSRIFYEARSLRLRVPAEVVDWLAKWPQIEDVMKARHFNGREIAAARARLQILADYAGREFSRAMFQGVDVWEG